MWWANTTLIEDPEPSPFPDPDSGQYIKQTSIQVRWDDASQLDWFQGDDNHDRGFELEAYPASEDEIWSDDWYGDEDEGSWASNMPDAYRDDLTSDLTIKHFAVGTGDAKSLEPDQWYWANFDTNLGEADSGDARLSGQATSRAAWAHDEPVLPGGITAGPGEWAYCVLHFDSDSACFFAADTTLLEPPYAIESPFDAIYAVYGDCGEGFWRGDGMRCCMDIGS